MAKFSAFLGGDTRQTYRLIARLFFVFFFFFVLPLFSNARKHSVEPDVQVVAVERKACAGRRFGL